MELRLVLVEAVSVDRVSVVKTLVVELARRALSSQAQEMTLVEGRADRVGGAGHHLDVGVSDVAGVHGLDRLGHARKMRADIDEVGGDGRRDVAIEPQPVDDAVEAAALPLARLLELE